MLVVHHMHLHQVYHKYPHDPPPGGDLREGTGGIKPPPPTTSPRSMDTPLSSSSIFGMKQLSGRGEEEEEKGRKKKRVDMRPLYMFGLDSPLPTASLHHGK